jgi:hypothetical protein
MRIKIRFPKLRKYGELNSFVGPRRRTFFGIDDKKNKRAILGMVLVPNPTREYSD